MTRNTHALRPQHLFPVSQRRGEKSCLMSVFLVRIFALLISPIVHSHRSGAHTEREPGAVSLSSRRVRLGSG